jgi:hypothetical protein
MTANDVHTHPEMASGDVRVCDRCGRPLPALHKSEYTPARARLVATDGLCLCPDAAAPIPDHGPSLI